MSATDELRRMLDARGVAHSDHYLGTTWQGRNGMKHLAGEPMADGMLVVDMLTPEQAIAATLVSDREAELQRALNKAAGNWARADADLRKALDFMRIWISEDAHLGESAISYKLEKAEGLRKLGAIEDAIDAWNTRAIDGSTSDGYHTFDELYYHRTALFACLVALQPRQMAFKSWRHADGTMYEGMFIAGIYTSRGWCTYHCEAKWWPLFNCYEREFAPEWDGHTPSDAIHRLMADFLPEQEVRGEAAE